MHGSLSGIHVFNYSNWRPERERLSPTRRKVAVLCCVLCCGGGGCKSTAFTTYQRTRMENEKKEQNEKMVIDVEMYVFE